MPFFLHYLLSALLHQQQLAYSSTRIPRSQQLFPYFDKERQFHKFTELSSFSTIHLYITF